MTAWGLMQLSRQPPRSLPGASAYPPKPDAVAGAGEPSDPELLPRYQLYTRKGSACAAAWDAAHRGLTGGEDRGAQGRLSGSTRRKRESSDAHSMPAGLLRVPYARWTNNAERERWRSLAGAPPGAQASKRTLPDGNRRGYPCAHCKLQTGSLALGGARRVLRHRSRQEPSREWLRTNRLAPLAAEPRRGLQR